MRLSAKLGFPHVNARVVPTKVRVANMLADSGAAWTDVIAQHNSGTYNNQYVVVDLKLFRPGQVSVRVQRHGQRHSHGTQSGSGMKSGHE